MLEYFLRIPEAAPQVVHQTRELLSQLLHEVAAAVLLQLVQAVHLLLTNRSHLTLKLIVCRLPPSVSFS